MNLAKARTGSIEFPEAPVVPSPWEPLNLVVSSPSARAAFRSGGANTYSRAFASEFIIAAEWSTRPSSACLCDYSKRLPQTFTRYYTGLELLSSFFENSFLRLGE